MTNANRYNLGTNSDILCLRDPGAAQSLLCLAREPNVFALDHNPWNQLPRLVAGNRLGRPLTGLPPPTSYRLPGIEPSDPTKYSERLGAVEWESFTKPARPD